LRSGAPSDVERSTRIFVYVATERDVAETVRLQQHATGDGLTLGLREVHPETIVSAQLRLQTFAQRVLGTELHALYAAASEKYRRAGYR
jgi:hypothetical protein